MTRAEFEAARTALRYRLGTLDERPDSVALRYSCPPDPELVAEWGAYYSCVAAAVDGLLVVYPPNCSVRGEVVFEVTVRATAGTEVAA